MSLLDSRFPSLRLIAASVFLFAALGISGVRVAAQEQARVVHVFVALADNAHQGIVPVPPALGNGDDPGRNLYWGAAYGVRTFFRRSAGWKEIALFPDPSAAVLERAVFYHASGNVYLIADAYRGREIKEAIADFFEASAGLYSNTKIHVKAANGEQIEIPLEPDLVVYAGHDGLMDFAMEKTFAGQGGKQREAMILACASKAYFGRDLKPTGARPILWTTGLMAPEAYTLKDALDGWMAGEAPAQIRDRAAAAYAKYQKISVKAALRLFSGGW